MLKGTMIEALYILSAYTYIHAGTLYYDNFGDRAMYVSPTHLVMQLLLSITGMETTAAIHRHFCYEIAHHW